MSKFILPEERLPMPFSQNVYKNGKLYTTVNSCVTCSIVKVIEVLYAIKNGYYTELSKGYAYVMHSGIGDSGTVPEIVLKSMIEKGMGSVPYEMCTDYTEKPEICDIIESRPNLAQLDEEAKKWAIKGWNKVQASGKKEFISNIENYLKTHNVPLIGTLDRNTLNHSVVIVGYDDKYIYYHDHTGKDTIEKAKYDRWLNYFYYITIPDGGTDNMKQEHKKFKDVEDNRWSKKYIDKVCQEGDMNGVSDDMFAPGEPLTREQAAALICRLKYGME